MSIQTAAKMGRLAPHFAGSSPDQQQESRPQPSLQPQLQLQPQLLPPQELLPQQQQSTMMMMIHRQELLLPLLKHIFVTSL